MNWVEVLGNIQQYYFHSTLQIYCAQFVADALVLAATAQTCVCQEKVKCILVDSKTNKK